MSEDHRACLSSFTPDFQIISAYRDAVSESLFTLLGSSESTPQRSISLGKLLSSPKHSNNRTITLEQLMAEMPFVGRNGDIQSAANTIKEQFDYWAHLSKTGKSLQSLKDVANLCCTGPSGIGKTTYGQYLRVHLSQQSGPTSFDKAA